MAHFNGVIQWLGLLLPRLLLNFLSASYTSRPDVCIKFHDKGNQLLQDTHTIKVRGNKQDLARVLVCPHGPTLHLWTPAYSCSPSLYIHLLFLNVCLMNFKLQNQTRREEPYKNCLTSSYN